MGSTSDWKETMGAVNRSWETINTLYGDLPEAADVYKGFCPILPKRLTGTGNFQEMRDATKNYITKQAREHNHKQVLNRLSTRFGLDLDELGKYRELSRDWKNYIDSFVATMSNEAVEEFVSDKHFEWCYVRPNSPEYYENVNAIRQHFMSQAGLIRPMSGPVVLLVDVIYPTDADYERRGTAKKYRPKYDIDNCFKPIQDALDFHKKAPRGNGYRGYGHIGIVVDDSQFVKIVGEKHPRRDGERTGFYYTLLKADEQDENRVSSLNTDLANKYTTQHQRDFASKNTKEHSEVWENRLNEGLSEESKIQLQMATLANDRTPLDPTIAQRYVVLCHLYNRDIAAKFALDDQSRVSYEQALGMDVEGFLCTLENQVNELQEKLDIDVSTITKNTSILELNRMSFA